MTLGISILYSKPIPPDPELFSFLKPFSVDVWIYMGAAYLLVSLLLHILARLKQLKTIIIFKILDFLL